MVVMFLGECLYCYALWTSVCDGRPWAARCLGLACGIVSRLLPQMALFFHGSDCPAEVSGFVEVWQGRAVYGCLTCVISLFTGTCALPLSGFIVFTLQI